MKWPPGIVQEAHARLFDYQQRAIVRDVDSLLRRIVINLSINHYRRELEFPIEFVDVDRVAIRDPKAGPERELSAEQELWQVVDVVSAISARTCQIFLAQRGGYSYEEIASAFAIKPRTVEKHVKTGMVTIEEILWRES